MPTLHVIDDAQLCAAPVAGARMRDRLVADGSDSRALILGRGATAHAVGLNNFHTLPISQTRSPLRWISLRRWFNQHGPFDTVTAWSDLSHGLVKRAVKNTTTVYGPATPILIDPTRYNPEHRQPLRQRLGVPDRDMLILLTADRIEHTDTRGLIKLIGLMTDQQRPVRFLIHPDARRMLPARQMMKDLDLHENLIHYEHANEPWNTLPACDMVFVHGPAHRWQWTAIWAALAKVPVLAIQDLPTDPIDPVWTTWHCKATDWRQVSRAIMRSHSNRAVIADKLEANYRRVMRSTLQNLPDAPQPAFA